MRLVPGPVEERGSAVLAAPEAVGDGEHPDLRVSVAVEGGWGETSRFVLGDAGGGRTQAWAPEAAQRLSRRELC